MSYTHMDTIGMGKYNRTNFKDSGETKGFKASKLVPIITSLVDSWQDELWLLARTLINESTLYTATYIRSCKQSQELTAISHTLPDAISSTDCSFVTIGANSSTLSLVGFKI